MRVELGKERRLAFHDAASSCRGVSIAIALRPGHPLQFDVLIR